jgi:hypothetical protein
MIKSQELTPANIDQVRLAQRLGINCDYPMTQALLGFYIRKAIEARKTIKMK